MLMTNFERDYSLIISYTVVVIRYDYFDANCILTGTVWIGMNYIDPEPVTHIIRRSMSTTSMCYFCMTKTKKKSTFGLH